MKKFSTFLERCRIVAYYPALARLIGVKETVFLSQIIYWAPKKNGEKIFKSSTEIEEETGLSYKEQLSVRHNLVSAGLLKEEQSQGCIFFEPVKEKLDEIWEKQERVQYSSRWSKQIEKTRQQKCQLVIPEKPNEDCQLVIPDPDNLSFLNDPSYIRKDYKEKITGKPPQNHRVKTNGEGRKKMEPVKPSLDQVLDFAGEINLLESEARSFFFHYSAIGWVYGKAQIPIKDWKSALRGWKQRSKKWSNGPSTPNI